MKLRFVIILICYFILLESRNIYRPHDVTRPEIMTYWENDTSKVYRFKSCSLEYFPIFKSYDHEHFMENSLPKEEITYRHDKSKSVSGKKLDELIKEFIQELRERKKKFKSFTILKRQDFNTKCYSGNLVASFKDYPFILKLFMETPQSFCSPYSKGWQPALMYHMNGGLNRYLSGFLRIKNLNRVQEAVKNSEEWAKHLDFHRKWFWVADAPWFIVEGKNIGNNQDTKIRMPSIYATVADKVDKIREFTLSNKADRTFALSLCEYLENSIDPHIDNFVVEESSKKVVIIDTEYFPAIVGLKKRLKVDNYLEWYFKLAVKCLKDNFLCHKHYRRNLQANPTSIINGFHKE